MKRLIVLSLSVFMLLTSLVYAQENDRWYWVTSTDQYTAYVDTKTIKYNSEADTVDFFTKMVFPSQNISVVIKSKIDFNAGEFYSYDNYFYKLDNNEFIATKNDKGKASTILPDSFAEKVSIVVAGLVGRNK